MNQEMFKLLKTKVNTDLDLNDSNASEKSLKFSSLYNKYLNLYLQELKELKQIALDKDKIYGTLYNQYKFKNDFQLDSNKEIDIYVKADDKYYNKCLEYQNAEIIVKYLEETLSNITNSGFRIKNFIELYKMKLGL